MGLRMLLIKNHAHKKFSKKWKGKKRSKFPDYSLTSLFFQLNSQTFHWHFWQNEIPWIFQIFYGEKMQQTQPNVCQTPDSYICPRKDKPIVTHVVCLQGTFCRSYSTMCTLQSCKTITLKTINFVIYIITLSWKIKVFLLYRYHSGVLFYFLLHISYNCM